MGDHADMGVEADDGGEAASPVGIIPVDKPLGLTSAAVCNAIKWRLRQGGAPKRVKVGHAGTLDPMATGVLVVLVGRGATRLAESLMGGRKEYLARIDLAHTSVSDDMEREAVAAEVAAIPTLGEIEAALARFVGVISQRPPDHSAIRVDGKRAYKIARKGRDPNLAERPVTVHSIGVVEYEWPYLTIDVACGKGTYIRSIARDVGLSLGVGGMLAGLRRTRVGPFGIGQCVGLDSLPGVLTQGHLMAVDEMKIEPTIQVETSPEGERVPEADA